MKTKTILIIIGILIIIIVAQYFYFKAKTLDLEQKNIDLVEEKKVELKKIRDSAFVKINEITVESRNRFDSIINIPPTIKWQIYEKPIYFNRDLDASLDVISKYKYNETSKREN